MTPFAKFLLKVMLCLAPVSHHSFYEKPATTMARYQSIASDIATVSSTHHAFANDNKGVETGLLLVIISSQESGQYRAAVDTCRVGGDHNTSWSIFQLTNSYAPKYKICRDRKLAAIYAIKAIKQSFQMCHRLPYNSRLSAYDTGKCIRGEWISNKRMRMLARYLQTYSTDIALIP